MSEEGGIRRNLKRIFKLEVQLLFYGIALLAITSAIFYDPKIDEVVCVRCSKCLSVCAFKKKLA